MLSSSNLVENFATLCVVIIMDRLKELREEKGYTQSKVAELIGVQRYTYAKWEQGRVEPSICDLIKLSSVFNVSIDYMVGKTDDFGISVGGENGVILNADEEELVKAYRKLSSSTKSAMLSTLKSLSEKESK